MEMKFCVQRTLVFSSDLHTLSIAGCVGWHLPHEDLRHKKRIDNKSRKLIRPFQFNQFFMSYVGVFILRNVGYKTRTSWVGSVLVTKPDLQHVWVPTTNDAWPTPHCHSSTLKRVWATSSFARCRMRGSSPNYLPTHRIPTLDWTPWAPNLKVCFWSSTWTVHRKEEATLVVSFAPVHHAHTAWMLNVNGALSSLPAHTAPECAEKVPGMFWIEKLQTVG